jgi:excisionase family DNA binding protein
MTKRQIRLDRPATGDQPRSLQSAAPRTMTVADAAIALGISRSSAYDCVRTGDLPALRLGGRIIVPIQAIDQMLENASALPDA